MKDDLLDEAAPLLRARKAAREAPERSIFAYTLLPSVYGNTVWSIDLEKGH